jgi:hypothetical protein
VLFMNAKMTRERLNREVLLGEDLKRLKDFVWYSDPDFRDWREEAYNDGGPIEFNIFDPDGW